MERITITDLSATGHQRECENLIKEALKHGYKHGLIDGKQIKGRIGKSYKAQQHRIEVHIVPKKDTLHAHIDIHEDGVEQPLMLSYPITSEFRSKFA